MKLREAIITLAICGCGNQATGTGTDPLPTTTATTALDTQRAELGRLLFWDPVLSGTRDVACSTCHHPDFAYSDGCQLSVGVGGLGLGPTRAVSAIDPHRTTRNSQTVLNTAFNGITDDDRTVNAAQAPMFWDSRAKSLESQARGPLTALAEMRGGGFDEKQIFPELVARLTAIDEYQSQFAAAYADTGITEDTIVSAIATFERTLVSRDSSFDTDAMSAAALRGQQEFQRSGCDNCHSGPMFSDYQLHDLGIRSAGEAVTAFRTPSLRNVSRTGPYMHNGSIATLDGVFDFYRRVNGRTDPLLNRVRSPQGADRADVEAFFQALSDGSFDKLIPAQVPSGLPVGGAL